MEVKEIKNKVEKRFVQIMESVSQLEQISLSSWRILETNASGLFEKLRKSI